MAKIKNPLLNYENKWVALNNKQDKVVASANDLKNLHQKINKLKTKNVVLTWVPPFNVALAPNATI